MSQYSVRPRANTRALRGPGPGWGMRCEISPENPSKQSSALSMVNEPSAMSSHTARSESASGGAGVSVEVTVTRTSPRPPVWTTNRPGPPFTNWGSVGNHSGPVVRSRPVIAGRSYCRRSQPRSRSVAASVAPRAPSVYRLNIELMRIPLSYSVRFSVCSPLWFAYVNVQTN